jgi:hypothetical protein
MYVAPSEQSDGLPILRSRIGCAPRERARVRRRPASRGEASKGPVAARPNRSRFSTSVRARWCHVRVASDRTPPLDALAVQRKGFPVGRAVRVLRSPGSVSNQPQARISVPLTSRPSRTDGSSDRRAKDFTLTYRLAPPQTTPGTTKRNHEDTKTRKRNVVSRRHRGAVQPKFCRRFGARSPGRV